MLITRPFFFFFFFNDTATTEIYTLSLHDALPIYLQALLGHLAEMVDARGVTVHFSEARRHGLQNFRRYRRDRKSTRLNSSHLVISYAVFCLKKKTKRDRRTKSGRRTQC